MLAAAALIEAAMAPKSVATLDGTSGFWDNCASKSARVLHLRRLGRDRCRQASKRGLNCCVVGLQLRADVVRCTHEYVQLFIEDRLVAQEVFWLARTWLS